MSTKTVHLNLRLPADLHSIVKALADDERSLNSEIIVLLREASLKRLADRRTLGKLDRSNPDVKAFLEECGL